MIKKINKIKGLGLVFKNYSWDNNLPEFKKYNLIYGWNGSGKTTFSRLFDAISAAPLPAPEYEILDVDGNKYGNGQAFPRSIRVFNEDYVRRNLAVLESKTNSISILLGAENKELVEAIEADKKLLNGDPDNEAMPGKLSIFREKEESRKQSIKIKDGKFTDIAKTIGAAVGGNALRDYRKPQAEKDFLLLKEKAELEPGILAMHSATVKQDSIAEVALVKATELPTLTEAEPLDLKKVITASVLNSKLLLAKTVESVVLERLTKNPAIAFWVEQGLQIHLEHNIDVCEFCQQKIPADRILQLTKHFSDADKALKKELALQIESLNTIANSINALAVPDKSRFYTELQNEIELGGTQLKSAKVQIILDIRKLIIELESKKSKMTEKVDIVSHIDPQPLTTAIDHLNATIETHNKKTKEFDKIKRDAAEKLKQHYLSTIYDEVKALETIINNLTAETTQISQEIQEIRTRIKINTAKISSDEKACELLTEKLATFLGHKELQFVIEDNANAAGSEAGYRIMRGDKPAVGLSEGEKTAIAFVYFVVHLADQNFSISDGIVVIDDPVSSLDSGSMYQAFSFLKNAVIDAGQVIILTHSFDFLRLLINWQKHSNSSSSYYMIKNCYSNDERAGLIAKLDKELEKFESEYHYLFKLLKDFKNSQDDSIARAYPIPNIARKVWETFLMFSVPNSDSPFKKMETLKKCGYDAQKLDAIYKFTNDQSHITGAGFDPSLVPEAKKVTKELFDIMDAVFHQHFTILDSVTN